MARRACAYDRDVRRLVATALLVTAVAGPPARAESETRQTIEGVQELMAPASRLEVRCDLGLLATRRPGDGRAGLDVEIATRPDYWYGLGVAAIAGTTVTTTTTAGGTTVTTFETKDAVGISARFFKRLGPLVVSAGVVDSAGGAGIELRGLGDRLRLEVLATNWKPSDLRESPRVRLAAARSGGSSTSRRACSTCSTTRARAPTSASACVGAIRTSSRPSRGYGTDLHTAEPRPRCRKPPGLNSV